jgi:hypothetical protein
MPMIYPPNLPLTGGNGQTTPVGNVLYVNKSAPSGVLQNGSPGFPFLTLQAALNVASSNTAIYVFPGTYSENIVMPDLDGIAIIGSAEQNTTIINASPGHTFSWIPGATTGAAVTTFQMRQLTLSNTDTTGTYHALHIDANAVVFPNTFLSDECDINFVDVDGVGGVGKTAAFIRNAGFVFWTHGAIVGGDLYVTNCTQFAGRQLEIGTLIAPTNFVAEYDGNNPHNGLGRSNISIAEDTVVYGDVQLKGHPIYQEDVSSLIIGNVTGTLTSFYASGRDYCPALFFSAHHGQPGGTGGNLTLVFPDPQASGSAFNAVDFSTGHIIGAVNFTKTNFLPANARGLLYVAGQAQFDTTTANGLSFNGYVAADLRGAVFHQNVLQATGAAAIDRDRITFVQTITASPTTVPISPPLPTGATYAVAVGPSVAAAYGISAKAVNQFVLTGPASGTADITISRI